MDVYTRVRVSIFTPSRRKNTDPSQRLLSLEFEVLSPELSVTCSFSLWLVNSLSSVAEKYPFSLSSSTSSSSNSKVLRCGESKSFQLPSSTSLMSSESEFEVSRCGYAKLVCTSWALHTVLLTSSCSGDWRMLIFTSSMPAPITHSLISTLLYSRRQP
jgi:hypothetical protein